MLRVVTGGGSCTGRVVVDIDGPMAVLPSYGGRATVISSKAVFRGFTRLSPMVQTRVATAILAVPVNVIRRVASTSSARAV